MAAVPWKDWIPGVLNKEQTKKLGTKGYIQGLVEEEIDASSFDLHLTDEAYVLRRGSIKPCGGLYHVLLGNGEYAETFKPDSNSTFTLKRKSTYLFKLSERLHQLGDSSIYGQATAKSSVGRIDVLARLIVDGEDKYEGFEAKNIKSGDMYVEIIPITFNVRVRQGISVSQLRLFYGRPKVSEVSGEEYWKCVLHDVDKHDGMLSVDLQETEIQNELGCAFCAEDDIDEAIDLWDKEKNEKPDPCKYWKLLQAEEERLQIKKDAFYILRSREKIALPKSLAIYCRATDETIGEMRIHYAGFAHPWFGTGRKDEAKGTSLIFEVRGHVADVNLKHEEKLAHLKLFRMSEDAERPKEISYDDQTLTLSKYFQTWPETLGRTEDGQLYDAELTSVNERAGKD